MSLKESRRYRRTIEELAGRIERLRLGEDEGIDALLGSLEYKVATDVASIQRAIRNLEVSGRQLKAIGLAPL